MARISSTEANQALSTTGWGFISLHTADPGTTGASEVSGGSYARVAVTWGTPSSGTVANTNAPTVNLPASTTAAYVGVWSASSGGTYYTGLPMSPSVTTGASAGTVPFAVGALTVTAS